MKKRFLILLCILVITFSMGALYIRLYSPLWWEDLWFDWHFRSYRNYWEPFVDQNQIPKPLVVPDTGKTLCFVTLETRGEKHEYVKLHNYNIQNYVDYQNNKPSKNKYAYRFLTNCQSKIDHPHNAYWCKFFCIRDILEQDQYDYVVWLDSDTVINDFDLDFVRLLASYKSDWYVGVDDERFDHLNAGVVGICNSEKGKEILSVITDIYNDKKFQNKCIINQNKDTFNLSGSWAGVCYEQGVMNQILFYHYRDNVTVLSPDIIHNGPSCLGEFIIHLSSSSPKDRAICFRKYTPREENETDHSDSS